MPIQAIQLASTWNGAAACGMDAHNAFLATAIAARKELALANKDSLSSPKIHLKDLLLKEANPDPHLPSEVISASLRCLSNVLQLLEFHGITANSAQLAAFLKRTIAVFEVNEALVNNYDIRTLPLPSSIEFKETEAEMLQAAYHSAILLRPANFLKVAAITDLHHGPTPTYALGKARKLNNDALQILSQLVSVHSRLIFPDSIIDLGDRIEDSASTDLDRQSVIQVNETYSKAIPKVTTVLGNHDAHRINDFGAELILGRPDRYMAWTDTGYRFIALDSCAERIGDFQYQFDERQLNWLAHELSSTELPTIILVHHPIDNGPLDNSTWFPCQPEQAYPKNAETARGIILASKKVILVLSGHVHWNVVNYHEGIPFITVQSVTERCSDTNQPTEAYSLINLSPKTRTVDIGGREPIRLLDKQSKAPRC